MSDITISRDTELMVAQAEANTDPGSDFIDAWSVGEFTVLDSGRIILPEASLAGFERDALAQGLTVETTTVARLR